MRQNQILDGIEGIHPLPLRAQHLLQQAQILDRNPQRLRRGFQELHFFPRLAPAAGAAERQHPDHRFLTVYWQYHHMMNAALPQVFPRRLRHLREFDHRRAVFLEDVGLRFIGSSLRRPRLTQGPQRFRRQADVLRGHEMAAVHQLEPRRFRSYDGSQFLERRLHHGAVILAARNRGR